MYIHIVNRIKHLLFAALVLGAVEARAGEVSVAVAANFTDATRDLAALFEQATGHRVKPSFGSTGALYAQIAHGAPFEVFLAADTRRPETAEQAGLAVPGSGFVYAKGRLVLWAAKPGLFTDGEAYLRAGRYARLAMANPKTAPYGHAARQVMQRLGLWASAQTRMLRGDSIAQTFQFAATGNADAGFIAYSQLKAWSGGPGSTWVVPPSYYDPIAQGAVLLKKGEANPAAKAFLEFLRGVPARRVIEAYGYAVD